MEKYLRSWRQDALNRGQHDAAIYIGDKVLALTSRPLVSLPQHSSCWCNMWLTNGEKTVIRMLSG